MQRNCRQNGNNMARHIRTGDMVVIIAGRDRGKIGRGLRVVTSRNAVVVEGINRDWKPAGVDDTPEQPAPPARLYDRYRQEIAPALKEKLGRKNVLAVPRLEKIVLSMGIGRFATEGGDGKAKFQQAEKELSVIAGQ